VSQLPELLVNDLNDLQADSVSIGGLTHEVCGFGPTAEVVELNSLEALKCA
jgi:hypothetical protein